MKRLVLTFLSTAAVCAVLSASPIAAQDTVTGAPAGTAPVTVKGYGNPFGHTGAPTTSNIDPAHAIEPPERCHVDHDFNDAEAKITVVCSRD